MTERSGLSTILALYSPNITMDLTQQLGPVPPQAGCQWFGIL